MKNQASASAVTPTYGQRNRLLTKLGFNSYVEYLNSSLWTLIRGVVLTRDNNICKLCDKPAYTVHHLDYSEPTLRGQDLTKLVTVCYSCHKKVEFTKRGEKRTLVDSTRQYNLMVTKRIPRSLRHRCIVCGKRARKKSNLCSPCAR